MTETVEMRPVTFADFALVAELAQAVESLGFTIPTPVQAQAIPVALTGKDVVACAQTGTGKTAAFALPLLQRLLTHSDDRALVIAPTRELAVQIVDVITKLTLRTPQLRPALVIGGLGMRQQKAQMRNNPRIIVATPGRLVDHLQNRVGDLNNTTILVLDEADRMLDMGFAPQLNSILKMLPKERQTMLFSATLPENILAMANKFLRSPVRINIGQVSRPADKIDHQIIETVGSGKRDVILRELKNREGTVIIFARTKTRTEALAFFLKEKGIKVARIHGDRGQLQRQEALEGFRNGTYRVLVATDIASRGLDVPHIAHVVNYDLPQQPEDFVHRVGRTARAGAEGKALTILMPEDKDQWYEIQKIMNPQAGPGVLAPVRSKDLMRAKGKSAQGQAPRGRPGKVAHKFSGRRPR